MAAVPVQGGGRRARAPAPFARRGVRNLVVLSILSEVGAVVYAIIMTKSVDLDWQMRAIRKDQKLLERLREERKAKIDELKERTNYYLTQKLIQKYDLDPAAKAAAASVLATKLGADSGLKYNVSSASEVIPSNGLRNRKHTKAKGSSTGNAADDHNTGQAITWKLWNLLESLGIIKAQVPVTVVGWQRFVAVAICIMARLARKEDFPHVTYCCPHCHALNM
uniref:Uncharacterized protein n=1 Tax=Oryza nivara TaxID=4536 RepID=A0A0E0H3A5_ORYNI